MTSCPWLHFPDDDDVQDPPVAPRQRPPGGRFEAVNEELIEMARQDGWDALTDRARQIGPSDGATRENRLRELGVITGIRSAVETAALRRAVCATVRVRVATPERCAGFEQWLGGQFDILEVLRCTGDFHYELRLACRDLKRLHTTIAAIRQAGGAVETETTVGILGNPWTAQVD